MILIVKRSARCEPRQGITLLELMLVLAILVIFTSMAIPAIQPLMNGQRLRKSGELVRIEWAKARVKSMSTGRTHMFLYQQGGNQFKVEPYFTEEDYLETSLDGAQQSGQAGATTTGIGNTTLQDSTDQSKMIIPRNQLPEGVMFVQSAVELDERSAMMQQTGELSQLGGEWSQPILFYPDGTTSDAEVILGNERQRYIFVRLRSLTGLAKVSDVLSINEVPVQ